MARNEFLPMPSQSPLEHDESLMGFVLRMANANGVQGIHWLYQKLGRDKLNRFKFEDCRAIGIIFGAAVEDIERTMWRRRFSDGIPVNTLDMIKVTKPYLIRPLRPQICSQCMAEDRYCRLNWDLQFVCACHIHNCSLVDRCPQCGRYLQWMRPFLQHCNCGLSWKKIAPNEQASGTATIRLASLFQQKIKPASLSFIPLDSFEITLLELSVDAISKLIWIFGLKEHIDSHIGPGHSQQKLRTEQASICAERGYLRLKAFSCAAVSEGPCTPLDSINLSGLKAFVREADSISDIRFAQWLSREVTRQSGGKYNLGSSGQRQLNLF